MLGFSVSQMVGGDKFELLNPYLEDPAKTPPDYDFEDFPPGQLEYVGYFDVANGTFGGDHLYLHPGPPRRHGDHLLPQGPAGRRPACSRRPTPDSWLAAAEALNKDGVAGNSMIAKSGDVSLFLVDFWTRFTALGGELMSGSPQTKDFTPNLTGEQSVAALQHMIDCTKFAAKGVTQYDFTASVDAFAAGKTAMMLMWATIGGTVFDPAKSKVADKIDVAVPMGGKPVRGGWGIGIPKNAKNKDAAWAVHHLPDVEGVGEVPGRHLQDRPEPHLDVQRPRPRRVGAVPAGLGPGVRDGDDPAARARCPRRSRSSRPAPRSSAAR